MHSAGLNQIILYLASAFSIMSLGVYFFNLTRGKSKPNPATWITWFAIGFINLATYFFVAKGSLLKALPLIFVFMGITAVTIYSFICGNFSKLKRVDAVCLFLSFIVGILWQITGDPELANLILQVVYVISFIPTVYGLVKGTLHESLTPWALAIVGYSLMIVAIIINWDNSSWVELAHPFLNGVLGNGVVAYLAMAKKSPTKRPVRASLLFDQSTPETNLI